MVGRGRKAEAGAPVVAELAAIGGFWQLPVWFWRHKPAMIGPCWRMGQGSPAQEGEYDHCTVSGPGRGARRRRADTPGQGVICLAVAIPHTHAADAGLSGQLCADLGQLVYTLFLRLKPLQHANRADTARPGGFGFWPVASRSAFL